MQKGFRTPLSRLLALLALALVACGEIRSEPIADAGSGSPDNSDSGAAGDEGGAMTDAAGARDGRSESPRDGCVPKCAGKACGDDGCGGTCGACGVQNKCGADGQCHCAPQCSGRECGPDGCGGTCGTCAGSGATCSVGGRCQCTPYCGQRTCGDDGCSGSCGTCPSLYKCVINGSCQKDPGSVCGSATCGSAASCCHCNGQPICYALFNGMTCESLGAGCN